MALGTLHTHPAAREPWDEHTNPGELLMSKHAPSRRDFLKGAAATGAALGSLSIARSAHAAFGGPLKAALIGCGGRGGGAASDMLSVADDVKLVAVADAFEGQAKGAANQLKQRYPEKTDITPERVFVGLDAYQKAIACGVDLVLLATPPGFGPRRLSGPSPRPAYWPP
jgi:hypothetical protein